MKARTLLVTAMFAALSIPALAQDKTPGINQRQENQQDRIKQGVKSGELTRGEARHLEAQQGRIQANKLEDKANGKVTAKERAQLTREQNRASRDIYRAKHNGRTTN